MRGLFLAHVHQVLDQHAEGRAPVPDVVLPDDPVAFELQQPDQAVSDDGGPEVADVHLLGGIGRGVIDHYGQRALGLGHAQAGGA